MIIDPSREPQDQNAESAKSDSIKNEYSDLGNEAETKILIPNYSALVEKLSNDLNDVSIPLVSDRYTKLIKENDERVSDPLAQEFVGFMLGSREYLVQEAEYNRLKSLRTKGDKPSTGEIELHEKVISHNNKLRTLIENQRDNFTLVQLETWYAKFLGGNEVKAKGDVMGQVGEIALFEALRSEPGLVDVRYGTFDDDTNGGDVVGLLADRSATVYIDAKSGAQNESICRDKGDIGFQVTVGVDNSFIDEHGYVSDTGKQRIAFSIGIALEKERVARNHRIANTK